MEQIERAQIEKTPFEASHHELHQKYQKPRNDGKSFFFFHALKKTKE